MGRGALAALACSAPQQVKPELKATPPDAVVVVTAELRGYLGPCGCSENMRGGIARAALQLDAIRAEGRPTFFIDSGDGLFGNAQIPELAVPQQERKAKALAQSLLAMKLDTRVTGALDDVRGAAFREALKLPEVPPDGVQILHQAGFALGVVSGRTAAELSERAKLARATPGVSFVIGLFPGSQSDAVEAARGATVDVVVAQHARDELAGESNRLLRSEPPVIQLQSKGRSLLRLDLWNGAGSQAQLISGASERDRELLALDERIESLRAQTNAPGLDPQLLKLKQTKLDEVVQRRAALAAEPLPAPVGKKAFAVRFVPLESSLPEAPNVKAVVDAYDADVGQMNLAAAKAHGQDCPAVKKGVPGFVGNAACLDCHKEAFPAWNASKHAHGYATLAEKKKQFHLDCIGCHVTGYQQPGGVCRLDKVEGREGIGCEACHGPGSVHADDPTATNILPGNDAKVCKGCHDRENSPHFEFDTYVAQILGPGHGTAAKH